MRPFSPVPLTRVEIEIELPRQPADRRAGEDAGEVGLGGARSRREGGRQIARRDGRGFGRRAASSSSFACASFSCAGETGAAGPPASSFAIRAPIETLSPTLAMSCVILPAAGDGTSIVALSDSSVTSGCSALTVSPGFTRTSMTGTSLKSPMSGTVMSIVAVLGDAGAAAAFAGAGAATAGAAAAALAGAAF